MNTREVVRILLVEDLFDDIIIAEESLKREGFSIESRYVDDISELKKVLNDFKPDIVISDYNLPGFTALDVLRICKAYDPLLPFIVFTGSIDEEVAVKSLKEGADDYVLKSHVKRLPFAIKEALTKRKLEEEKRKVIEAFKLSEERYRYICHVISDYAYAFKIDENNKMRGEWISESFYKVFGLTIPEIDAKGGWRSVVFPPDLPVADEHAKKVLSGSPDVAEFRFVTKEGEIRWLRDYAVPVIDEKTGKVIRIYGASQDITEQKKMADELRKMANRFQFLLNESPTITYSLKITNEGFIPQWVSENIYKITGYTVEEVLKPDWWINIVHPEYRDEVLKENRELLKKNQISCEYRIRKKDGSYIWIHDKLRVVRDEKGNVIELLGAWTDITEKKTLSEELERERLRLKNILEISPVGIIVADKKGRIIFANKVFCEIMKIKNNIQGSKCDDLQCKLLDSSGKLLSFEEMPIKKVLTSNKSLTFKEFQIEHPDGKRVMVSASASPIFDVKGNCEGAVCVILDITEHKKLEEQYYQAQKLEALGRLTGGIAHDFNNLLSVILGYTEMALLQIKEETPVKRYLFTIHETVEKAKDLTQRLLLFSKRQVPKIEVLDLNKVIESMAKMLSRIIGEDIELKLNLKEPLYYIKADRSQIEQVIMNLVVNARDAMPRGGKLIITTENIEFTEKDLGKFYDLNPGKYVVLSVTDTGVGMTEEVKKHLFEPFFTTKGDKGTGLGLSTVYGIVKNHSGYITVYSEPGKGSTFKIYLPATEEGLVKEEKEAIESEFPRGNERILVVEDNNEIREFLKTFLEERGYLVKDFANPLEAFNYIRNHPEFIDLIVSDFFMPDMTGLELIEKVREINKQVKIMFITGYQIDEGFLKRIKELNAELLVKPFSISDFLKKIRSLLDKS